MTRQGLPTGQMEQETQELLDEYNESYCWEYNDMVDFIKEHGEKDFREYYETYNRLVDDYGQNLVDEFIEDFYVSTIENFEDMYQGQYDSGADFAKQIATDCGYIKSYQGDLPSWIEIDWEKTWDNLSYDYTELLGGHIFNNNY
jgi:antirestriction protein